MVNLILAIFWFGIGLVLLCSHWLSPRGMGLFARGIVDTPAGWLALALGVFNLARWWMRRSYLGRRQQTHEALRNRANRRQSGHEPAGERDPNFIFTDEPRPEESPKSQD